MRLRDRIEYGTHSWNIFAGAKADMISIACAPAVSDRHFVGELNGTVQEH